MSPTDLSEVKAISAPFSFKSLDDGARTFRGLTSTWQEDLGGDVIHEGAFARTIDHFKSSGRVIPLMDGHPEGEGLAGQRVRRVLGKLVDAGEVKAGVDSGWQMVPDDPDSEAALRRIKGGFVTDLSIYYKAVRAEREKGTKDRPFGRRHIYELKWLSTGIVLQGMNPGAKADAMSVKALCDQLRDGELDDDYKAALTALTQDQKEYLRALLDAPPAPADQSPADTPKGLAPEDPQRLAIESLLRDLTLRRLAAA
jgi:hypothetical protein